MRRRNEDSSREEREVPYEYEGGRIEEEDAYLCLFCDSVLLCCITLVLVTKISHCQSYIFGVPRNYIT